MSWVWSFPSMVVTHFCGLSVSRQDQMLSSSIDPLVSRASCYPKVSSLSLLCMVRISSRLSFGSMVPETYMFNDHGQSHKSRNEKQDKIRLGHRRDYKGTSIGHNENYELQKAFLEIGSTIFAHWSASTRLGMTYRRIYESQTESQMCSSV